MSSETVNSLANATAFLDFANEGIIIELVRAFMHWQLETSPNSKKYNYVA